MTLSGPPLLASIVTVLLTAVPAVTGCTNPLDKHAVLGPEHNGDGFQKWLHSPNAQKYKHRTFIESTRVPCQGASFHWTIENDMISTSIAVKATGWVGLGWSEVGGMKGMDLMVYEHASNKLTDSWVSDGYVAPSPDPVDNQDWTLVATQRTSDGYLIVEAKRPLDTHDKRYDTPLLNDSNAWYSDHPILVAWGDTPQMMYHANNRAQAKVQLFLEDKIESKDDIDTLENFHKEMNVRSDGHFELMLPPKPVPKVVTTYFDECFPLSYLQKQGVLTTERPEVWIIGFELITPSTGIEPYIHHIIQMGHEAATNSMNPNACLNINTMMIADQVDRMRYQEGFGVGLGLTGNSYNAITLEYHVNNFDLNPNLNIGGLGIRYFYTTTKPKYELGMMAFGDPPLLALMNRPVGTGNVVHDFHCSSKQFTDQFEDDQVTVVIENLHLHLTGTRMVNNIIRNDKIVHSGQQNFYDFDQSGGGGLVGQDPFIIKKGDDIQTKCYYSSDTQRIWGYSTEQEMCIAYLQYYPKQPLPDYRCHGEHTVTNLPANTDFDRFSGVDDVFQPLQQQSLLPPPHPTTTTATATTGSSSSSTATASTSSSPPPPHSTTTTTSSTATASTSSSPPPPHPTTTTSSSTTASTTTTSSSISSATASTSSSSTEESETPTDYLDGWEPTIIVFFGALLLFFLSYFRNDLRIMGSYVVGSFSKKSKLAAEEKALESKPLDGGEVEDKELGGEMT